MRASRSRRRGRAGTLRLQGRRSGPAEEQALEDRPRARARRHWPCRRIHGHRTLQTLPQARHPRRWQEPVGPAGEYPFFFRLNRCYLLTGAGRFCFDREKGESIAAKLGGQPEFVQVDTRNAGMLEEALQGQYHTSSHGNAIQTSRVLCCD
jgi:hypothetical protein